MPRQLTRGVYVLHQQNVRPGVNTKFFVQEWNLKTAADRTALVNAINRVHGEGNVAQNQQPLATADWTLFYNLYNAPAPNLAVFNTTGTNAIIQYQHLSKRNPICSKPG